MDMKIEVSLTPDEVKQAIREYLRTWKKLDLKSVSFTVSQADYYSSNKFAGAKCEVEPIQEKPSSYTQWGDH